MKKLKQLEKYEFRFMPNIYDLTKNVINNKISNKSYIDAELKNKLRKPYYEISYAYIMCGTDIHMCVISGQIKKIINYAYVGCYINSEGLILSGIDNAVKSYTIEDDRIITYEDASGEFKDVILMAPCNLFDIKHGYKLEFKYNQKMGYDNYYDFRYIINKPLFIEGGDRELFLKEINKQFENVGRYDLLVDSYIAGMRTNSRDLLVDGEIDTYIKSLTVKEDMNEVDDLFA